MPTEPPAPHVGLTGHTGHAFSRGEVAADLAVHALGVLGALVAVPVLVTLAAVWQDRSAVIAAVAIYGVSMVAMLAFSASYNLLSVRAAGRRVTELFRRLDHAAIYVKIAGTYTPYAVIAGGPVGRWLLIGVWGGALVGTVAKLFAPDRWTAASIVLYLALGWAIVFAAGPVSEALAVPTMVLIVVGGLIYTAGVPFHLWTALPYQNAIWHGFVLVATFVFYAAMMVELTVGT